MLIDGQFVTGGGALEDIINPATGKKIISVREASEEQVIAAVDAADRAFPLWAKTVPRERAAMLLVSTRTQPIWPPLSRSIAGNPTVRC